MVRDGCIVNLSDPFDGESQFPKGNGISDVYDIAKTVFTIMIGSLADGEQAGRLPEAQPGSRNLQKIRNFSDVIFFSHKSFPDP